MMRYWIVIIIIAVYSPQIACQNGSNDNNVSPKRSNKSDSLTASVDTAHPDGVTQSEKDSEANQGAENDSSTFPKEDTDGDSFLDSINESMLKESEEKRDSDETGSEEDKNPDDGSWVLMIDDKKISRQAFEKEYQGFCRLSPQKVSKKKYANLYLQNYIFKDKAKEYFASQSKKSLLKFIRRKAMIDYYLKSQVQSRKIQTPSSQRLKAFYSQLIQQKGFGHLRFNKHRSKIKQLYKLQELNRRTGELDQALKGRYKIISNDEWEEDVISKYIHNRYNKKNALGRHYKKYWLYKILLGKEVKKSAIKKNLSFQKNKKTLQKRKGQKSKIMTNKEIGIHKNVKKDLTEVPKPMVDSMIHNTMTTIDPDDRVSSKPTLAKDGNPLAEEFEDFQKNNNFKASNRLENNEKLSARTIESDDESPSGKLKPLFIKGQYKHRRSIPLCIKDVETCIQYYRLAQLNPKLIRVLRKSPQARQQFINRFLLEELIYKQLKDTKIIYSQ
ncbi:MAG TPA: hypothetical protein ENI73_06110, partial [Spirochaetes bacterium]|nr:hypothetical protein [Spirochaetota bacterium]